MKPMNINEVTLRMKYSLRRYTVGCDDGDDDAPTERLLHIQRLVIIVGRDPTAT